ncbi:PLDc N-terminal domain-containing protein [Peijinzhouia sedimentorum]
MFGLGIIGTIIYIFTLIDVLRSSFSSSTDKLIWILVVIFLPLVGTILWFLIGRGKSTR